MTHDLYRVLPHRSVLIRRRWLDDMQSDERMVEDYEHVPCGMPLNREQIVVDNWCHHCAATINKAAKKRANAEWQTA